MIFLLSRYAIVALALVGLTAVVRWRSTKLGLGLIATLAAWSWLVTWAPLERPYGLQPGTTTSFETAIVASGAARGNVFEGWVVGTRNPRPAWSALGLFVAPGNPTRARALLEWLTPLMMVAVPCVVFWLLVSPGGRDRWRALAGAFAAVFASTVPLDAFARYSFVYHGIFFESPERSLGLVLVLLALGLVWMGGHAHVVLGGLVLGAVAWVDVRLFAWGALAVAAGRVIAPTPAPPGPRTWPAVAIGVGVAGPQIFHWWRGSFLDRIPTAEDVRAYQLGFLDVFGITADMGWIFVLAVVALPFLWRSRDGAGHRILSLLAASYGFWLVSAIAYRVSPFSNPELAYYLVRVATAIAAGAGALELARRVVSKAQGSGLAPKLAAAPTAFALVFLFMLPDTALFLWRPLMTNPIYYQSFYEWDQSILRLERWLLDNTDADTIVLTGEDTGEWVAALTGRRVWMAERTLSREQARERRRAVRRLFLSQDRAMVRDAIDTIDANVLVLDPALREVYWELGETALESSPMFEKVHQIGDRYSIYLVR